MGEHNSELTEKLLDLMQRTGYNIIQQNGQRKFGPPPDWTGPQPQKGSEVFIGKLPREIFEDELVPIFSKAGKIYEMRLMMDFSGTNRGYAFVTYSNRAEADAAVKKLNGFEIRRGRRIGVVKSVDNCRLFIGGIPKTKSKEELLVELSKKVNGIVDIILYRNCFNTRFNRGFAFVEFTTHRAAAMARRCLIPGCVKLWDQEVMVDWAEPEPTIDDEQLKRVKVLYARNFLMSTTTAAIRRVFETAINSRIEKVKKLYDYAFIHFYDRAHAEIAMTKLQNVNIDGSNIEITWAKPVDRDLYKIQKLTKGNAKFNNKHDLSQTLLLYKQHLDKQEYANSPKEDEGFGSVCAGGSTCESPTDCTLSNCMKSPSNEYALAPAKLDALCKRYMWPQPVYQYQKYLSHIGEVLWVCQVELHVGMPLVPIAQRIGPFITRAFHSEQHAQIEAAEIALHNIKILRSELVQQPSVMTTPPTSLAQLYPPVMPTIPTTCVSLPYNYLNPHFYQGPQSVLPFQTNTLCDAFNGVLR